MTDKESLLKVKEKLVEIVNVKYKKTHSDVYIGNGQFCDFCIDNALEALVELNKVIDKQ